MSILNLFANLLTPQYPAFFLVRTPTMEEAEAKEGYFQGELLVEIDYRKEDVNFWDGTSSQPRLLKFLCGSRTSSGEWRVTSGSFRVLLSFVPFFIICMMPGFSIGRSTSMQRGFTMAWLVAGIILVLFNGSDDPNTRSFKRIGSL
jgi:hypothetical protein